MNCVVSERNKNLVVRLNCEIDHHTAGEIRDKVEREFSRSPAKNIMFDFTNVTFMDSSGIGMILGRYRTAEMKGGKVFALNINKQLSKIFEMSGLKKIINCFDGLAEEIS
jgi:stage II sporulation protein AA (anti-sigma F factor antagonist)